MSSFGKKIILISIIFVIIIFIYKYNMDSNDKPNNKVVKAKEGNYTLYYFYSPYCQWCKMFMNEWDKLEKISYNKYNIEPKKIDTTLSENDNLSFYFNIEEIPTIILVSPKGNFKYVGKRTNYDIEMFIIEILKSH